MSGKISLLLGIFLVAASVADGAEPPPPPGTLSGTMLPGSADNSRVLLLRNGQVIKGQIERNGQYYSVTSPDTELQIRAADVEFCCHDLREGYRQKKAAIQPSDIEQHLQLFLWCERHALLDCAGDELHAAEALDHEHPMISVLQRRLKVELQQKKEPLRQAENGPPPPSDEQLDQMTRGMPPGTVVSFVQVIQPILLNHCPGANGYSLPGQKRLQLMRPPLGEAPSRRITERNLYAVLECIDWENPGESPLLKASVGSGAAATVGSFPRKYSMQYQKLAQWAYQVAQKPMPVDETGNGDVENVSFSEKAGGAPTPSGGAMTPSAPRLPYLPSLKRGKGKAAAESAADCSPESGSNLENGGPAKPSADGRRSGASQAVRKTPAEAAAAAMDAIDPYDPAAFNNQGPAVLPTPAARVLKGDK